MENAMLKARGAWGHQELRKGPGVDSHHQPSGGANLADAFTWDFWPPAMWQNTSLLFKPPNLRYFCYGHPSKDTAPWALSKDICEKQEYQTWWRKFLQHQWREPSSSLPFQAQGTGCRKPKWTGVTWQRQGHWFHLKCVGKGSVRMGEGIPTPAEKPKRIKRCPNAKRWKPASLFRGKFCKVHHPPASQTSKRLKTNKKHISRKENKQCVVRCLLLNLSS